MRKEWIKICMIVSLLFSSLGLVACGKSFHLPELPSVDQDSLYKTMTETVYSKTSVDVEEKEDVYVIHITIPDLSALKVTKNDEVALLKEMIDQISKDSYPMIIVDKEVPIDEPLDSSICREYMQEALLENMTILIDRIDLEDK